MNRSKFVLCWLSSLCRTHLFKYPRSPSVTKSLLNITLLDWEPRSSNLLEPRSSNLLKPRLAWIMATPSECCLTRYTWLHVSHHCLSFVVWFTRYTPVLAKCVTADCSLAPVNWDIKMDVIKCNLNYLKFVQEILLKNHIHFFLNL